MPIIVLLNLRPGVDPAEGKVWAASVDAPTVRALPSVSGFRVDALTGLLMGQGTLPFAYVEGIDLADPGGFGTDVSSPQMQQIAAVFQRFADQPLFLTTREVGV